MGAAKTIVHGKMIVVKPMTEEQQTQKKSKKKKGRKKKKRISLSTLILVTILLAGISIMMYPTVSDWWNSMHASMAIASYKEAVENMSGEDKEKILEEARRYNASLPNGANFQLDEGQYAEYESLLDVSGTGVMGYIRIDSIGVDLPVYHGTEESVLQIAIGHISGSSLPVGGERTHCILSGHRGLPSAKLFTDLDKVTEGDVFTVTVLDSTITYQVDQIRIVLPEETDELAITDGKDYCTLVTCTPYGVNTHRILVRGTRIDNIDGDHVITAEAVRIPSYIVIPAVGIPILFVLLLIMMIYYRRKKPRKSQQEILDELKKLK